MLTTNILCSLNKRIILILVYAISCFIVCQSVETNLIVLIFI